MRRTWPGSTPKLIITAMSRVFSITIMVSAIRMFSAATITISAITMNVTICSSLSAREQLAVFLGPVGGHVALARGLLDGLAQSRGARFRLSTLKLITDSRSGSSKSRCASARRMKSHLRSRT